MSHEHRQHPERYYDDEGEAYDGADYDEGEASRYPDDEQQPVWKYGPSPSLVITDEHHAAAHEAAKVHPYPDEPLTWDEYVSGTRPLLPSAIWWDTGADE